MNGKQYIYHRIKKRKLILFFLFCFISQIFNTPTFSQSNTLQLDLKNATIEQVLNVIEQKTSYRFLYNKQSINVSRKVTVVGKKLEVSNILNEIFSGTNISYSINGKQIVLIKGEKKNSEPTNRKITGHVTDDKGESVIGAIVFVEGMANKGTITDSEGKFVLEVPAGVKIEVRNVGYLTQEFQVDEKEAYDIKLEEDVKKLDEVVVIGYGSQKKESVVGAISQTTNKDLQRTGNVTDLKQALTGQLPGLITITSSGEPGGTQDGQSATAIYIRGQNSWNGGQPLILVDGVERGMENVDVNEVQSISVLKDASATAVFGVKGANGVILITTKRGAKGKPQISFNYNSTAITPSKLPQKLDSYNTLLIKDAAIEREVPLNESSWADYMPTEIVDRYKQPQTAEYSMIYPNVDWRKAMFKDVSFSHRAAINVEGGSDFIQYFGSLTYLHEGDMFKDYNNHKGYNPNFNFDRFNFRSNLDFKLTSTTNLSVNLSGYYSQKNSNYSYNTVNTGTNSMIWSSVYAMPPDVCLVQYPDGRWGTSRSLPAEQLQNPVALLYNTGILHYRTVQLTSDFALKQNLDFITKGLSAKATLSYDNSVRTQTGINDVTNNIRNETNSNTPEKIINSGLYTGPDQDPSEYTENVPEAASNAFDWVVRPWNAVQEGVATPAYTGVMPILRRMVYQLQLNYARKFNLNNIGATGVFKREKYAFGSVFPSYREDWVFRGTYDYDTRYLFEMNGAYNGSEQFGPGYRFDFFPSVAVGWYVSNEKFFKKIDWISKLKFRYSMGEVGDDRGNRWMYASQYSYGGTSRLNANPNQGSSYTWYRQSVVGNPDVHWEKALKKDFGIELSVFHNLLSVNYDYFTEKRSDILIEGGSRSVPSYYGTTAPTANLGKVNSHGHELEILFDKSLSNGMHFWSTLAFSHTENKIEFKDDPELLDSYQKNAGHTIGQTTTQVCTGYYNNWDDVFASVPTETNDSKKLPGEYNLLDYNGDGQITSLDNVPYGYSGIPQNTYSYTLGMDYKGFSVMAQFYAVNNVSRWMTPLNFANYQDVLFSCVSDYWTKANQSSSSPLPRWKTVGQNLGNHYLYDGSYVRLKTAEIAYSFENKWVKRAGMSSLKIYLNGENLFLWTKLPDDREAATQGGDTSSGAYPTCKRFNLGVDLTF